MKALFRCSVIIILVLSMFGTITAFGLEYEPLEMEVQNRLEHRKNRPSQEVVLSFDPHQIVPDKIIKNNNRLSVMQQEFALYFLDGKHKGVEIVGNDGTKNGLFVRMGLAIDQQIIETYLDKDTYFYSAEDVAVGLQSIEGGVRQIIVIKSEKAPTSYSIAFDLPKGSYFKKLESDFENGQGIVILNQNGEHIAGIAPPWAFDAEGLEVPTFFEIDGTTLIQVIDHTNAAYPVTADPNMCVTYYSPDSYWVHRGGTYGLTLSLRPTACGRVFTGFLVRPYHWNEVVSKFSGSPNWSNSTGLKDQLYCHFDLAPFKSRWNIEPARPSVGYWQTLQAGCNPVH